MIKVKTNYVFSHVIIAKINSHSWNNYICQNNKINIANIEIVGNQAISLRNYSHNLIIIIEKKINLFYDLNRIQNHNLQVIKMLNLKNMRNNSN